MYVASERADGLGNGGGDCAEEGIKKHRSFVERTYEMVSDVSCDDVIHWASDGSSFVVGSKARMETEVLGRFFVSANHASFIRQLRTYGFDRLDNKAFARHNMRFGHPYFRRGCQHLIKDITRSDSAAAVAEYKKRMLWLEQEVERLSAENAQIRLMYRQQQLDKNGDPAVSVPAVDASHSHQFKMQQIEIERLAAENTQLRGQHVHLLEIESLAAESDAKRSRKLVDLEAERLAAAGLRSRQIIDTLSSRLVPRWTP